MAGNLDWLPKGPKICSVCAFPAEDLDPESGMCLDCKIEEEENLQEEEDE